MSTLNYFQNTKNTLKEQVTLFWTYRHCTWVLPYYSIYLYQEMSKSKEDQIKLISYCFCSKITT